jgi:hypothetical protein
MTRLSAGGLRSRENSGAASRRESEGVRGVGANSAHRLDPAHESCAWPTFRPASQAVLGPRACHGKGHGGLARCPIPARLLRSKWGSLGSDRGLSGGIRLEWKPASCNGVQRADRSNSREHENPVVAVVLASAAATSRESSCLSMEASRRYKRIMQRRHQEATLTGSWRARRRAINWIAAVGCFACAIAYTVTNRPVGTIVTLIVLGVVNLAFILVR